MSDLHEVSHALRHPLSTDYAHHHAIVRDGASMNDAATLVSMLEALQIDGQPKETDCPYCDPRNNQWSPPKGLALWRRRSRRMPGVASTVIRASLAASRPAVLCTWITEAFFDPDPATFAIRDDSASVVGEHAVVVVGAMDDPTGKAEAFLIRNSWGETWGSKGHAWLKSRYVDANATAVVQFEG